MPDSSSQTFTIPGASGNIETSFPGVTNYAQFETALQAVFNSEDNVVPGKVALNNFGSSVGLPDGYFSVGIGIADADGLAHINTKIAEWNS